MTKREKALEDALRTLIGEVESADDDNVFADYKYTGLIQHAIERGLAAIELQSD